MRVLEAMSLAVTLAQLPLPTTVTLDRSNIDIEQQAGPEARWGRGSIDPPIFLNYIYTYFNFLGSYVKILIL